MHICTHTVKRNTLMHTSIHNQTQAYSHYSNHKHTKAFTNKCLQTHTQHTHITHKHIHTYATIISEQWKFPKVVLTN